MILAVVFVLTILLITGWQVPRHFGKVERPGEFGDMFGIANALFSSLAFAGVIYPLLQQQCEIQRHRETLQLTADVAPFEYCNHKISSLREAKVPELGNRNMDKAEQLDHDIRLFLDNHENLCRSLAESRGLKFPDAPEIAGKS